MTTAVLEDGSNAQKISSNQLVYLASLPRVGSTWFGYKFNEISGISFRFEPFHENLITGTHSTLRQQFKLLKYGRSLRHPPRKNHYHSDYRFQRGGGIRLFKKRFCFQNYHLYPGQSDEPLREYVSSLFQEATQRKLLSVVKCTRSALRARWIAGHFTGKFIYIFRSPRLMDNSHFSFRGYCNPYIRDYALTVGQNSTSRVFEDFARWSELDSYVGDSLEDERAYYRETLLRRGKRYDRQYHFDCLCFFWVIALAEATHYADLILDMDALGDPQVRTKVQAKIERQTHVAVDLSDYSPNIPRIQRVLSRHRMTVSNEMLILIREALSLVKPEWERAFDFHLTDSTKAAICSIGGRKKPRANKTPVVPWSEQPWHFAS